MKIPMVDCLNLLHLGGSGALASHSAAVPGFPFVTAVPYAVASDHCPWLLLSGLAEHCRNVCSDERVSLLIQQRGGDVLSTERMTLLGRLRLAEPDATTRDRLLRYCPDFAAYLQLGDFQFFRMEPERIRFIGGFGRMGWVEGGDWAALPRLAPACEADLLARYPDVLLGVDVFGVDFRQGGCLSREAFPEEADERTVAAYVDAIMRTKEAS